MLCQAVDARVQPQVHLKLNFCSEWKDTNRKQPWHQKEVQRNICDLFQYSGIKNFQLPHRCVNCYFGTTDFD